MIEPSGEVRDVLLNLITDRDQVIANMKAEIHLLHQALRCAEQQRYEYLTNLSTTQARCTELEIESRTINAILRGKQ